MSTTSPCETLISAPILDEPFSPIDKLFDSSPDADIILRSSECHEFRVPKLYIINSSPVLEKLIRTSSNPGIMATPAGHEPSSPSTVQLNENYTILSSLLTFIFPVSPALPPSIEQTMELLSVAQKYKMDTVLIHIRDRIARQDPPVIHAENAFYVYSLAQKYRLRDEALQAARMTLNSPITIENLEDKLDTMPGSFLHELWKYHQRVRGSLMLDLIEFRRSGARGTLKDLQCNNLSSFGYPSWLDDYFVSISKSPAAFDLTRFHMALTRHSAPGGSSPGCTHCASISIETIQLLWTALTAVFHKSLRRAEGDLSLVEEEPHTQGYIEPTGETSPPPEDFNMRHTDVILRSSDGASFRVHRLVLTTASPFFDDLFSLPQPDEDEMIDGIHVVRLSEDKVVLRSLITMLYPIPSVLPDSYDKVLDLLTASQKYDMAAVQSSIRAEVSRKSYPSLSGAEAFRMYAIASGKGLLPEVENFARLTLDHPMTFESIGDELRLFNGWALRDLVRFRKRCRDSLVSCLESFLDYRDGPSKIWTCCFHSHLLNAQPQAPGQGLLSRWLCDIISQAIKELKQSYTLPLLKQQNFRKQYMTALQQHITETNCLFCSRVYIMDGDAFWLQVKSKLTIARDKVPVLSN
ncbi:hypothetical protein EDB86DRAFT_2958365 [Lactarius hatsudake]|nr:hypothetical protein EDB86DRAFT_2958365 [Lactarius hatsudake]